MAARPRMTYGGNPVHAEHQARQELFGEAAASGVPSNGAAGRGPLARDQLDAMETRQVMDHAVDQHKETTATARRALQVVEQTKELQASTMTALQDQGRQMDRIAVDMDRIGTDLTYSQRILRYMSTCCCLGFFCSSCIEPEREAADRHWRGGMGGASGGPPAGAPSQAHSSASRAQKQQVQQQQQRPQQGGPSYPGVTTSGLKEAGFGEQAALIQSETKQQDAILDQISQGLDQLKHGAVAMQEELGRQDQGVNRLHGDAHVLHSKLRVVNRDGFKI